VDRGGKGVLIGGANDFQEYVLQYYSIKSDFTSNDMNAIAEENLHTKEEIDAEWRSFLELSHPIKLCITNANSGSAYAMIGAAGSGDVFGTDTEVSLCLLGSEDDLPALRGTEMEAFDLAYPLLRKISVTSDPHEAFNDCTAIVILDELMKNEDESKDSWLQRNAEYFINYAKIINDTARQDVRVIVAGDGPLNFNTSMIIKNAPRIPRQNIVACARRFENEVKAILAKKLDVNSAGIVNAIIWGSINGANMVDINRTRVHGYDGAIWGPPSYSIAVQEMIYDKKWLEEEFFEAVSRHRETMETMLKKPKCMSQGAAIATLLKHWWSGESGGGHVFSLGVCSEGE
jgi:malate/lactate dehydrogenase